MNRRKCLGSALAAAGASLLSKDGVAATNGIHEAARSDRRSLGAFPISK